MNSTSIPKNKLLTQRDETEISTDRERDGFQQFVLHNLTKQMMIAYMKANAFYSENMYDFSFKSW
jgi:hypothetical protein